MDKGNEDIGLSVEEEAELLAQYGTYDPFFDEVLDVQAPSQYRSIYDSRNLFITGDSEATAAEDAPATTAPALDALDLTAPVEFFLLRHLCGSSATQRPSSYTEALSYAVATLNSTRGAREDGNGEVPPLVKQYRHLMDDVDSAGVHAGYFSLVNESDDDVDAQLEMLIAEAEAEIQRKDFHYDPAQDPVFQERLRQLRDRCATPINDEAYDDDADLLTSEDVAAIEGGVSERCTVPVLLPEEAAELDALRLVDEAAAVKKQRKREIRQQQLDAVEKAGEVERSSALQSCGKSFTASSPAQLSELLESIRTIDERDAAVEEQACLQIKRNAQINMKVHQQEFHQEKRAAAVAKGQLALEDFSRRIDVLIPPPAEAVDFNMPQDAVKSTTQSQPIAGEAKKKKKSLQELRKASQRAEFLSRREAQERRVMREEEDLVAAISRQIDIQRVRVEEQRSQLLQQEETNRRAIWGEEAVAHVELLVREERQRSALEQLIAHRAVQQQAMRMSDLSTSFDAIRSGILDTESYEWGDLTAAARTEHDEIVAHERAVEDTLRKLEKQIVRELHERREAFWRTQREVARERCDTILGQCLAHDAYGDAYPNSFEAKAVDQVAIVDTCGFGSRFEQLIAGVSAKTQWMQAFKGDAVASLQALNVALHASLLNRNTSMKRSVTKESSFRSNPRTPTPPTASIGEECKDACSATTDVDTVVLNERLVRKLHPLHFAAAALDASRTPQIFQTLSLVLEGINRLDYTSLSAMSVHTGASDGPVFAAERLRLAPYVRVLDLNCNALRTIDAEKLLSTFSSLRSLKLGSNHLDAFAATSKEYPSLTSLDLSANQLERVQCTTSFTELRKLLVYSNKITNFDEAACGCKKLRELEMSRNNVKDLRGVEKLTILGSLDLSRNQLESAAEIKSNMLLQKLFLSCNKIAAFPDAPLLFLRQLFLNENRITDIPECIAWLPALSELHLESNAIQSVVGLRGCVQLTTLKLAFNQLSNGIEDLIPLSACKRLRVLSINDNPMMMRSPFLASEVERYVLSTFPQLKELNTDALTNEKKQKALATFIGTDAAFVRALAASVCPTLGDSPYDILRFASYVAAICACHAGASPSVRAAMGKFALAQAQDVMLDRLQREYEALHVQGHRRLQQALAVEENFKTRMKESGGYVLDSQSTQSPAIESRNHVDSLQQSQRHLEIMREPVTLNTHFNVHSASVMYEHRARSHRESKAKKKISEWLVGRLLIRKAMVQLEALREASELGRVRRWTRAARVIQPLWRGAIVRKRLRAVHSGVDDGDDDELFQKVTFDQPDGPVGFSNFSALLQGAIMSHPQAAQFHVKSVSASNKAELRGGSAPSAPHEFTNQRPQSNPIASRPRGGGSEDANSISKGTDFSPAKSARSALDDEWGAALADQLRKKQRKMDKAKQDLIRKEFMSDPLRAKRLQGGKQ